MRSICIVSDDISSCIVMGHTGGIAFQTESYQILQYLHILNVHLPDVAKIT